MLSKNKDLGLLILRLSTGFLMLLHGINKLLNGTKGIEFLLTSKGLPSFFAYGVHIGETLVPILLIIGFRSRLAALVFAFNCLVAALLAHPADIVTLNKHGGWGVELLGLYFFNAIVLFFTGGGKYSLSSNNKFD